MKKTFTILVILLVGLEFGLVYGNQQDKIMGIVYSLRGKVTLLVQKMGEKVLLHPGTELIQSGKIKLEEASSVTILFKDGQKRTFWGPGVISLEKLPPLIPKPDLSERIMRKLSQFLENASKNVEVITGAIRTPTALAEKFYLISPRLGAITHSSTVFYWKKMPSATGYKISIFEFENDENPIFERVTTDTLCLLFPDRAGLLRGKRYYWKVRVMGTEPTVEDSAWFRILTYEEEKQAQIRLRKASTPPATDPLLKIMTLDDHHLYHSEFETLREWVAFEPENSTYLLLLADLLGTKMGLRGLAGVYAKKWLLSLKTGGKTPLENPGE